MEFGQRARAMNQEVGNELEQRDLTGLPASISKVPEPRKLADFSDLAFFTTGPVYQHCRVPFDIFGEYRGYTDQEGNEYDGPYCVFRFNNPILTGATGDPVASEWSYTVEAMAAGEPFERFCRFMRSQTIRRQATREYWEVRQESLVIPDPVTIQNRVHDPRDLDHFTAITVFLPTGLSHHVSASPVLQHYSIMLRQSAACSTVKRVGEAMLGAIG